MQIPQRTAEIVANPKKMPPKRSLLYLRRKNLQPLRREEPPLGKKVKQLDANSHAQYSAQLVEQSGSVYLKVRSLHQEVARDEEKQRDGEFTNVEQRLAYRTPYAMG
jgi:hypothetical protein